MAAPAIALQRLAQQRLSQKPFQMPDQVLQMLAIHADRVVERKIADVIPVLALDIVEDLGIRAVTVEGGLYTALLSPMRQVNILLTGDEDGQALLGVRDDTTAGPSVAIPHNIVRER